jgi:hypothetical protein
LIYKESQTAAFSFFNQITPFGPAQGIDPAGLVPRWRLSGRSISGGNKASDCGRQRLKAIILRPGTN